MADRNPRFDTPSLYRRPPRDVEKEKRWADAFLLGGAGMMFLGCGLVLLIFSALGLYILGYAIFHG
jgi:hypothetical protein